MSRMSRQFPLCSQWVFTLAVARRDMVATSEDAVAKKSRIVSAVGTARGVGAAIGVPRAIVKGEGLRTSAAGADMQSGRQSWNQGQEQCGRGSEGAVAGMG